MSSEAPKAPKAYEPRPPSSQRSRPRPVPAIKPSKPEGSSNKLVYSLAGIASLFLLGGLCYFGYELTKPTKRPSTKKTGLTGKGKVNKTKQARPKGDYYDIVVKRGAGQAIGIMMCPGENKVPGAFVAACKANIDLGLRIGSQLVEVNGKWLDSDMNFKEAALLLAKSCSPEGKLCFRKNPELNSKWQKADKTKTEGNELYKKKQIDSSIAKYSDAIKLHPTNKVYYSNKVLALLSKAEHTTGERIPIYHEALSDCRVMRELDVFENYQKGHHVRGVVLLRMGKFKHARTAFQTVLRIDPKNKIALARLQDCQKAIAAAAAEAELKTKESNKDPVSEEKKQVPVTAAEAEQKKKEPNEEPVAEEKKQVAETPKVNGHEEVSKDNASTEKCTSATLTQMVEDLKEEVKETVKTSEKSKNDEADRKLPTEAAKDGETKKESATHVVENSVEASQGESETILQKSEEQTAEEAPSELVTKPEEAKEEPLEEVNDTEAVYQNETHSSAPQNEAKVDEPTKSVDKAEEETNAEGNTEEKSQGDTSKKIVEDLVKTTMERAVGQVVESGGEVTAKGNAESVAAVAAIAVKSLENSAAATTTTSKPEDLVEGEVAKV
jgi:hypothetical protein